jgi:predicted GNAT family acetyltransferase
MNRGIKMEIRHFQDPVIFQDEVLAYLLGHEAENNLLLGILASVIAGEYRDREPYLALVEEDGRPRLVAMCTPPFPVLLSYEKTLPDESMIRAVLEDLVATLGAGFSGFSGNKELSACFAAAWENLTGDRPQLKMAMRIYKLEQVRKVEVVPGRMRPMVKEDLDLVREWYSGFNRDTKGDNPVPDQVERQVQRYAGADPKQRGLMLWELEGRPVSMAGYAGPTPHGIRIGAVYTPPEQRQKGYASACTANLSQHLLDMGFDFCFLFTDLLNPTSNHIYQQIGYDPVCDVDRYDLVPEKA